MYAEITIKFDDGRVISRDVFSIMNASSKSFVGGGVQEECGLFILDGYDFGPRVRPTPEAAHYIEEARARSKDH